MNALTAAFVRSVKHRSGKSADRYRDGNGLLLQVMPNGSKQWLQRLALDGKIVEREVKGKLRRWRVTSDYGLGGYPERSLSEVRKLAFDNLMEARKYRRARPRGEAEDGREGCGASGPSSSGRSQRARARTTPLARWPVPGRGRRWRRSTTRPCCIGGSGRARPDPGVQGAGAREARVRAACADSSQVERGASCGLAGGRP